MNIFSPDEHSYMKTPEGYGVVLEIVEDNAMTRPYFDNTRKLVDSVPDGQLIKDFKLNDIMPKGAVIATMGKFILKKITGKL
jgi:hypothetical protein